MKDYEFKNLVNAEFFGIDEQSNQLIEECAELSQAMSKYRRATIYGAGDGMDEIIHITEEIADVEVMIAQIKHLLHIMPEAVELFKKKKVFRTSRKAVKMDEENIRRVLLQMQI